MLRLLGAASLLAACTDVASAGSLVPAAALEAEDAKAGSCLLQKQAGQQRVQLQQGQQEQKQQEAKQEAKQELKQESKQESKKEVQQQRQEDEQQKQRKRQEEKPLDQRKEVYTPPPTSAPAVAQVASAAAEHVAVLATAAAPAVPMRTKRMPLVLGMIDGSELHYAGEVHPKSLSASQALASKTEALAERSKVVLMVIDMFPPLWMLGIDRLYLGSITTGIAKLAVCVFTCGVGGVVWGLVDFASVVSNALRKEDSIEAFGMDATFRKDEVGVAFWLAIVDILAVPLLVSGTCRWWQYRKSLRDQILSSAKDVSKPEAAAS